MRTERWYRAVWRWHFYAGLFCVPFVLWLSVTGGIYLFKPQIEAALYAPYRNVATGPTLSPDAVAARAVAAVPGSVLHKYVLPESPADAVQVLVGKGAEDVRVWVNPQSGAVLHAVPEEERLMRVVFRLHGELLAGERGSALVEAAACWTIVMLLTGLFLWWPRGGARLAGVLYPRLRRGRATFWRDIHAVTGLWVSLGALFLIASGLPWASAWGDYFREVRAVTGTTYGPQDWSAGASADAADRARADAGMRAMMSDHAEHGGMAMMHMAPAPAALDVVVSTAETLGFAAPVEVSPPTAHGAPWQVRSQAENRPRRDSAEIAADGTLVGVRRFADNHWIDRAVGYGVAIHEGAWAALANQLVNLAVLVGLVLLCVSSVVQWWRRRPTGQLGAPASLAPLRHSWALVALVLALALAMPLFGLSLALAVAVEVMLKRLSPAIRRWMGWREPRVAA
ncbi:PepSY domain-containing protein [Novosphingobium sp. AP12]|uniref:PepSY-associated TM helix domain-containing protein n=1 Tax=Novosphingobium sp. AP12 TaxID=1144305 RepID=UPI000271F69A|nr:PepSY domain-containing protein [Novosphingobium sp. AP12]EJL23046.1 putative iron-regulated membrane protein [Novosphingobium sp. AP12]